MENIIKLKGFFGETDALHLNEKGYGVVKDNKLKLSLYEILFLCEERDFNCVNSDNRVLSVDDLIKLGTKKDDEFLIKYTVYKDLRKRGYIVKSGLKFGSNFRVYDKGEFGKEHSKWVLMIVHESKPFTWHEFSAKNRVAHSTRKKLLIAVVDDEFSVSYYEVRWMRM